MCSPQGSSCREVQGTSSGKVEKEDIPFPYMELCDTLSMVGVELTASWIFTRKVNNNELQKRVNSCIGSWKSTGGLRKLG